MCGRFNQWASPVEMQKFFNTLRAIDDVPPPRYNIPPTAMTPVVMLDGEARMMRNMRWGLIPSWSKDHKIGYRTINARCETVAAKPAFRSAFKRRRCLVAATGYYEWKKLDAKNKQPHCIQMRDDQPFAMAGLWETWKGPKDEPLDDPIQSFTIITTDANDLTAEVHDRMPVILAPDNFDTWMESDTDAEQLTSLMVPFDSEAMTMFPVSKYVGKVGNEGPECIEEV